MPLPKSRLSREVALAIAALVIARPIPAGACAGSSTKILGVPVWGTDPNEGNTWGAMPVLLGVCPDERTQWIFAPSVTWNSLIRYTGSLRLYVYPDRETTVTALASASTNINYGAFAGLQRLPSDPGRWTDEASARLERSLFARFFGLGPDTPESAMSSYTYMRALVSERRGLNIGHDLNLGVIVGFERDTIEDRGVPGLPLAPETFPDVPGIHGTSMVLSQGFDVRYDDRVGGDYADRGLRLDLWGSVVEGLVDSPAFLRGGAQANAIWPELSWLSGTARIYTSWVSSAAVPFYLQSELGGAFLLRGYDTGRFIDRDAWTVEVEQRVRVLQTHMFGVTADWQVAPFVTTGQVFHAVSEVLSNPQAAVGIGMRAFVRPSVVGRVDLAWGSEGLKAYVEIGYPY